MDLPINEPHMRIAALDIGTNTALMLIAEHDDNTILRTIRDEHSIVRLGEGVDKTHRINEDAYQRLSEILARYKKIIAEENVDRIAAIGTSALRDAENKDNIISRIQNDFGISVEVISGDEEAALTYRGATYEIQSDPSAVIAVIDIGGGSTEIAFGDGAGYHFGKSIDIGAVRLTEQGVNLGNLEEKESDIQKMFSNAFQSPTPPTLLVAVAGTPTALAAMLLGLQYFDESKVNGFILTSSEIDKLLPLLFSLTPEQLIERYPVIAKGRADILPAGALILREAMRFLGVDSLRVNTRGLRYGLALRELGM